METDLKLVIDDEASQRDVGFVGSVIICRPGGIKIYKGGLAENEVVSRRITKRLNRTIKLYAINTDGFITVFHPNDVDADDLLPTIIEEVETANAKYGMVDCGEIAVYKQMGV